MVTTALPPVFPVIVNGAESPFQLPQLREITSVLVQDHASVLLTGIMPPTVAVIVLLLLDVIFRFTLDDDNERVPPHCDTGYTVKLFVPKFKTFPFKQVTFLSTV